MPRRHYIAQRRESVKDLFPKKLAQVSRPIEGHATSMTEDGELATMLGEKPISPNSIPCESPNVTLYGVVSKKFG